MQLQKTIRLLIVALALAAVLLALAAPGAIGARNRTTLNSVNVGLYSDAACTQSLTAINWGALTPGAAASRTIYVKNTGDATLVLSFVAGSWSPIQSQSLLMVSWNRGGYTLTAGTIVAATLTLQVVPSAGSLSSFSFTITISGTTSGK